MSQPRLPSPGGKTLLSAVQLLPSSSLFVAFFQLNTERESIVSHGNTHLLYALLTGVSRCPVATEPLVPLHLTPIPTREYRMLKFAVGPWVAQKYGDHCGRENGPPVTMRRPR